MEFVIIEKLTRAMQLHQQGQLAAAAEIYQAILGEDSANADAWHLLGMIAHQSGDAAKSAEFIRRAIAVRPDIADFHNNLAEVYNSLGDHAAEEASCRDAIRLRPTFFQAHNNLGNALLRQQRFSEAIACYEDAIRLEPAYARAIASCGIAWRSRGAACRQIGQFEKAEESFRKALTYQPDDALVHNDLGEVLWSLQQAEAAVVCFRKALQIRPNLAAAHFNLANALSHAGRRDQAERGYRDCLTHDPQFSGAMTNLAICLSDQGRVEEAMTWFVAAHELIGDARSHSHRLFCRQYLPGESPDLLQAAHVAWNAEHAARFESSWPSFAVGGDRDRPLRLGFVSRDFSLHPVGYFLVGPLEALDRHRFEVVCYADQRQVDAMTERIRSAADQWSCVAGLSDDALAKRIREDRIDILVDLAGHTAGHRLLTFARKPAPVQVSWMGYVGTTGLSAMDYLLSDRFHTPAGYETYFTEQTIRLPDGYVCYTPPENSPAVDALPAAGRGFATFGCFNYPAKISREVMWLWARILQQVPDSRLLLKYAGFDSHGARTYFREKFAALGVREERVLLEGASPHAELLNRYNSVDIALDTLPYSGGLTTCEALWMGVPVVTRAGSTFAGRHSYSHLSNAGFGELIADSPLEYVERAVSLASDVPRLAERRLRLRERLAASPLCDVQGFTRGLEDALREMWIQKQIA